MINDWTVIPTKDWKIYRPVATTLNESVTMVKDKMVTSYLNRKYNLWCEHFRLWCYHSNIFISVFLPRLLCNTERTYISTSYLHKDSRGRRNTVSLASLNEWTHLIVTISYSFLRSMHMPFRSRFPPQISSYNLNSFRLTFSTITLLQCTNRHGSRTWPQLWQKYSWTEFG